MVHDPTLMYSEIIATPTSDVRPVVTFSLYAVAYASGISGVNLNEMEVAGVPTAVVNATHVWKSSELSWTLPTHVPSVEAVAVA